MSARWNPFYFSSLFARLGSISANPVCGLRLFSHGMWFDRDHHFECKPDMCFEDVLLWRFRQGNPLPYEAGKSPRRQHQTINWPDIFRPKVIGGKRRHRTEAAAVTHQHHKVTIVSNEAVTMFGKNQNSRTWPTNITKNVARLVIKSEIHAQKTRPTALPILANPTMPAATTALTLVAS